MKQHMVEKKKILDLLKAHNINDLYYSDFAEIIKTSRTKFNYDDALNFLAEKALKTLLEESEKNTSSQFAKMIYAINKIISCREEDGFEIGDKPVQTLKQILQKKQEQPIASLDELANNLLNDLEALMTELGYTGQETIYPTEQEPVSQTEQNKQLEEELQETKKLLIEYEQTIQTTEKQLRKLEKVLKKSNTTTENLKATNQNLVNNIKELKENITQYKRNELAFQKNITAKELTITNLTKIKENLQNEIQILKNNTEELEQEMAELKIILDDYYKKDKQVLQEKQIRNLILTQLYHKPTSMEELQKILALNGQQASIAQINEQLHLLNHRVHISGPSFSTIPPTYKIDTTPIVTPTPLYLSVAPEQNELDILIISDLHKNFQIHLPEVDMVYNYASANNIKYIFNLGDNFSIPPEPNHTITVEELVQLEKQIEDFIKNFPENTGIYLFNLGGNHDESMIRYGLDPLNIFQQQRHDFINLGYKHAQVNLGNPLTSTNTIHLHHPRYRLSEIFGLDPTRDSAVKRYLTNYYQKQVLDRDDVYCDFVAHIHRSKLDILNSYCQVPSLVKDRVANGAWHLKIYFDSKEDISYMIFIPLIVMNNQLKATTEIPYQKIKKKN